MGIKTPAHPDAGELAVINKPLADTLTTKVITKRQELQQYAGAWNELLRQSAASTIFLTWQWINTWLDVMHPEAELLVVVVEDENGRMVAITPFYHTRMRLLGAVDYRCLRVIGDCESGAEYPDLIVRAGYEQAVMRLLIEALLERHNKWDCLWLPNVAGWTGALERFQALCSLAGFYLHERERNFASVTLPDTHERYWELLSGNARSNIRRHTKRLGVAYVELVRCEDAIDVPRFLTALFDLHRRRWAGVGEEGSFVRRPRMVRFYEQFAPAALKQGWLRLYALKVDGVVRAVQYGYAYNGTFHQLQEGFDPETFRGIGNILRNLVFKACIEEGLNDYDFLGEFTDHKRRWGAKIRFGHDLFAGRPGMKNRLLFTKYVWPTGRYLRESAVRDRRAARRSNRRVSMTSTQGRFRRLWKGSMRRIWSRRRIFVYVADLAQITQEVITTKVDVQFRANCPEALRILASGDPRYGLPPHQVTDLSRQVDEGEVCISGWIGDELAFYEWIQFKYHRLAGPTMLPIAPRQAFLYRAFTREDFRGMRIYPAGLAHGCRWLAQKEYARAFGFHDEDNAASKRGILRAGMRPVGDYYVYKFLGGNKLVGAKWATYDQLLRREVSGQ